MFSKAYVVGVSCVCSVFLSSRFFYYYYFTFISATDICVVNRVQMALKRCRGASGTVHSKQAPMWQGRLGAITRIFWCVCLFIWPSWSHRWHIQYELAWPRGNSNVKGDGQQATDVGAAGVADGGRAFVEVNHWQTNETIPCCHSLSHISLWTFWTPRKCVFRAAIKRMPFS